MIHNLIYHWEQHKESKCIIELHDETLRDGLQATYVRQPSLEEKLQFIDLLVSLNIAAANIGFPATGQQSQKEISEIASYVKKNRYTIKLVCAGRMLEKDIMAIAEIMHKTGVEIEAGLFLASSKIRTLVEKWDLQEMTSMIRKMIPLAKRNGLKVMFVAEDTTRAFPETIQALYSTALGSGADRLCISDTVGCATPTSTYKLVSFVKKIAGDIKIDWHGHNDRGLALANALMAVKAGADCIQATALGVGERAGNISMHECMINLFQMGYIDGDLAGLKSYVHCAEKMLDFSILPNDPFIGDEVFSTASGVHAAAIKKAVEMGQREVAGIVYTPFDPHMVDRELDVQIGPFSGKSNVEWVLTKLGIRPTERLVQIILLLAKTMNRVLLQKEIFEAVHSQQYKLVGVVRSPS